MDLPPWGPIDDLVVATGGRDEQVAQAVKEAGPEAVVALLATEIEVRGAAPPDLAGRAVNLCIEHEGHAFRYGVTFDGGRLRVRPGRHDDVLAEVRWELVDLVRSLYPSRSGYRSTSRRVEVETWPWTRRDGDLTSEQIDEMVRRGEADREQMSVQAHLRFTELFQGVQAVLAACSSEAVGLDQLAATYGSDKWGGLHWYTPHYERHFAALRYDPVRMLEIGIGGYRYESLGGDSLYTWQRFFPRGLVHGLDVHAKPNVTGPRIRTVQGDQSDAGYLDELARTIGPLDVVIDDGSHVNDHVRTSFEALFPHVRPGGWYVIEDLHTSYWPAFGGEPPPGSSRTTLGLLKDLLDGLHVSELGDDEADGPVDPARFPSDVCVYHNLVFLRKGLDGERGVPAWIRERASAQMTRSD
ncbi:MAG TPA: class I SAM-dependent methyltransferase [Acidimicrobiales bacterium]|nr:class I SAM-dependent methyltransferase [Acidimicrobiales bacterium]